jgi:hypothetical protein
VFLRENMDKRDGVMASSKEQMRSSVRVRVQGEITSKGGKDQGGTADHPRGLRRKVRTSYEKTPYLDRGDDDLKMTQIKGGQSPKCQDKPRGGRCDRAGPERAWAGRSVRTSPGGFWPGSARPLT